MDQTKTSTDTSFDQSTINTIFESDESQAKKRKVSMENVSRNETSSLKDDTSYSLNESQDVPSSPWEIRCMQAEIVDRDITISTLKSELKSRANSYAHKTSIYKNKIKDLEKELDKSMKQVLDLDKHLKYFRKADQNNELIKLRNKSRTDKQSYDETISELQKSNTLEGKCRQSEHDMGSSLEIIQQKYKDLEKNYCSTNEKCDKLQEENAAMQLKIQKNAEINKEFLNQQHELENAQREIKTLGEEIKSYSEWKQMHKTYENNMCKLQDMEMTNQRLRKENRELNNCIGDKLVLEEEVEHLKTRLLMKEKISEDIIGLNAKIPYIEEELAAFKQIAIDYCSPNLPTTFHLRSHIDEILKKHLILFGENGSIKAEKNAISRQIDLLKTQVATLTKTENDLQKKLKDHEASFYRMQMKLRLLVAEQNCYKQLIENYEKSVPTPETGIDAQIRLRLEMLEKTVVGYKEMCSSLEKELQSAKSSPDHEIDEEIIRMVEGMTAIDQKWIIRMILKDMNLGIGPAMILSTYHPSARDFFDLYSNLSRVCSLVESGEIFELKGNVEPFQPFHPMLCLRGSIGNLHEVMTRKEFYLETKMDGERFQMHIVDGKYKYFSRNSNENDNYRADASQGSLTPFVHPLFKIQIKNLILDGEMMVWNREHMMYHTKGEHFDVKSIRANDSTLRPCFCVYDILYLNDCCLINKPYAERIRLLATIFNEKPGVLTLCKPIKIRDSDHIIECLNKAFDEKEEGVVIKEADSMYAPGKRNAGWIKIKPDYVDGLVSDFDMLVIGGYYSQSRKLVYKFLIGVQKKGHTRDEFIAVSNISLGLSLAKLIEINNKLQPYWKNCAHVKSGRSTITNHPPGMNFGSQIPDVWIEPKNSIIFEVKASELVKSSSFGTHYTLRFPRIEAVRTDKNWYDCCQSDEFETFCSSNDAVKKIVKRQIRSTDINSMIPSKRKKPSTTKEMKKQFSASSTVGNINLLYDDLSEVEGVEGNERADELARLGSSTIAYGPEPYIPIPQSLRMPENPPSETQDSWELRGTTFRRCQTRTCHTRQVPGSNAKVYLNDEGE